MLEVLRDISPGMNICTEENGKYAFTKMDCALLVMSAENEALFHDPVKEIALLLLKGDVAFETKNSVYTGSRSCLFTERPYCLHVPAGVEVNVRSKDKRSELLVLKTSNENAFVEKFYTPDMIIESHFGEGVWNETAKRLVRDIFNYENAPYSNLVLGEILNKPGRWSSYTPHWHRQPEVYYYRFSKPQGFGVSIIGDNAYVIKNDSFAAIPGGLCHPQVTAPGYHMYYAWAIRHLEGDPWNERLFDPVHNWLNDPTLGKEEDALL